MNTSPTSHKNRPKEWIPLTSYAIVDKVPDSLLLQDHLLPFAGSQPDPKFLWGLYGTSSMNHVLFLADSYASKVKKRLLTIQVLYHVDNFERVKAKITPDIADESGFIHVGRLQAEFRDDLREMILLELRATMSKNQLNNLKGMSLDEIMIRRPETVGVVFGYNRKLNVVVHPVLQLYDRNDKKPVHVATVRRSDERLAVVGVRYLENITVSF